MARLPDVLEIMGEEYKKVNISRSDVNLQYEIAFRELRGADDRERVWLCFQDIIQAVDDIKRLRQGEGFTEEDLGNIKDFLTDIEGDIDYWKTLFEGFKE